MRGQGSSNVYPVEGKGIAATMRFVDRQHGVTVTVNSPSASGVKQGKAGLSQAFCC